MAYRGKRFYGDAFQLVKSDILLPLLALGAGMVLIKYYMDQQSSDVPYTGDTSWDILPDPVFQSTVPYMQFAPSQMQTSAKGKANITGWEGRRNAAYRDSGGHWSIGVGHLIVPGDGLGPSSVISDPTIDALFADDINEAENIVKQDVNVPLTQGQFDALVDFTFQFGDALGHASDGTPSTLLNLLNAGDYAGAAAQFKRWVNVRNPAGVLIPVAQLQQRRAAAASMFA
jgi:lysozyme